MTFRVRVEDPASLSVTEYDLDEPDDRERFEEIYGEGLMTRVEHLEESESLEITCIERVDEWSDPTPAPELTPEECPVCGTVPKLIHDRLGYRFRCYCCGDESPPQRTLKEAVQGWNSDMSTAYKVEAADPVLCSHCGTVPELVQSPEGYRFRCPKCGVTTLPHRTIINAAEAWEAVQW